MQRFLPITCLVLFTTSCMNYQYMTVSSAGVQKNENQEFVFENDSIRLEYNFHGLNAPVHLKVFNKLQQPVYIDWKRSALVVNNKAVSYVASSVHLHGSLQATSFDWTRDFSTTNGQFNGNLRIPEQADFLPPQSYITKTPLGVTNRFFDNLPDTVYHIYKYYAAGGLKQRVKRASFEESTTPLVFKSYLTIIMANEQASPVVYEHKFYISELVRTGLNPSNYLFTNEKRGDLFYVQEKSGFGKAAEGVGIIAGAAVLTSAAIRESKNNNKDK